MNFISSTYTGSVTDAARNELSPYLHPGDVVVDATAGQGHDCVELALAVGSDGRVVGLDIQEEAVRLATQRIESEGLAQVEILCGCHSRWSSFLPADLKGCIRAFVYNLGYLPGGDHAVTTQVETTLQSVREAIHWLAPGGVIRLLFYRGHPEGEAEYQAVRSTLESFLGDASELVEHLVASGDSSAPVLMIIRPDS